MGRWIARLLFLAASAVLLLWAYEGLTRTDQSTSMLPFLESLGGGYGVVVTVGVLWGFLLFTPGADFMRRPSSASRPGAHRRLTEVAVARVVEMSPTGLTVNEVAQYHLYLEVLPAQDEPFLAHLRILLDAQRLQEIRPGASIPVRYDPAATDNVNLADLQDPQVQEKLVAWRIEQGLIEPELVAARTRGVLAPANVVALRPTGARRHGQVQLDVDLLVAPEDGTTPWNATTRAYVHPQALSRVQTGSPVFAMYEPRAPRLVALLLEKPEVQAR
ncbi:hypothetical protein ACXET9_06675 [Brachybacterium sp. DNPG3]